MAGKEDKIIELLIELKTVTAYMAHVLKDLHTQALGSTIGTSTYNTFFKQEEEEDDE